MSGVGGRPFPSETEAAAALCALIGEILEIEDVTVDEDFFELGGTSLKGAVLIAQIERRFGYRLRPADLYEAPTAAMLAGRLRPGAIDTNDVFSVAAFPSTHSGTTSAPVFMVHLIKPELARALGRRRPVIGLSYGLSAVADDTGWPPPTGIEALAAHYVAQMKRTRPDGPYHLAGYSKAGIIAWEMAAQLWEAGTEVGVLCLIDTRPRPSWEAWRRVGWRENLSNIASTPPRVLWLLAQRFALGRLIAGAEWLTKRLSSTSETPQERWERSEKPNRLDLIDLQRDVYRMTPLPGQPVLIEAVRPPGLRSEPVSLASAYDEAGIPPDVYRLVQFPGDHGSVVEGPLAEKVAEAIDEAVRTYESERLL